MRALDVEIRKRRVVYNGPRALQRILLEKNQVLFIAELHFFVLRRAAGVLFGDYLTKLKFPTACN